MYAHWFQRHGFCTLQADSAADAYWLASELMPSAVITDIGLAGNEDGLHLTRRLKGDDRMRDVPVVVLTGYVLTQAQEAAAEAGCDLFVPKPCLPAELSREIERLLRPRLCDDVTRAIRSPGPGR
jgi:CheY-like chemotaxis protein